MKSIKYLCLIPVIGAFIAIFYLMYILTFKNIKEVKKLVFLASLFFFVSIFLFTIILISINITANISFILSIIIGLYGYSFSCFSIINKLM